MIIKIILILSLLLSLAYFIKNVNKVSVKAWKRLVLFFLPLFGIISVVYPNIIDNLAKKIGIGRGADLLLYVLVIIFIFVTLNFYLKFKEISLKQGKIISKIAILEKEKEEKES